VQQLKKDPVDRKKLPLLEESPDEALRLAADVFVNGSQDAARELFSRIDAARVRFGDVDAAAGHARARVQAAMAGEDLTVSDLQLISALSSEKAAADTEDLRTSCRVEAAAHQVEIATGTVPDASVMVMATETSKIGTGTGEDQGTYLPEARCVVVIHSATDHTLRHELVHATQPRQVGHGPAARIKIIDGIADALALEAGSESEFLSYANEAAAVLGWGQALQRDRRRWLRELNSTSTPEITMGATMGLDGQTACDVFYDAQLAAEGRGRAFDDRVAEASKAVLARMPEDEPRD
jgi:hypothetical protein